MLRHKDRMFDPAPHKVLYCYGIYQPLFDEIERELPYVRFQQGLPSERDVSELSDREQCHVIVLDDLMDEVTSSPDMEALFVRGMHHRHLTVIYLNQNLFCKGKHSRTINLNTHVLVLMKNPRDVSQIQCLARQSFPGKSKFVMESYKDATSESYGYLVLDFSPKALDDHRVRSKIFPDEDTIVYQSL
ncbi:hypothetical protein BOW08_12365 [Solemya velum gill symbiont]|nr:hypothetical protein BOW08_12365 [Solemya velum gill symbiont]